MIQLEEAIKLALEYEGRVHGLYAEAVKSATDDEGRRVFHVMAEEEKRHIEYLKSCLHDWQEEGHLSPEELKTVIPDKEEIDFQMSNLKERMEPQGREYDLELKLLRRALAVEIETSDFYRKMVDEVEPDGQALFRRFVEIEEGHVAIVEAEIDSVSGLGYWFGHKEFNLENG